MASSIATETKTTVHSDLTDDQLRYLGYVGRLGRLIRSSTRYLAYTSDVGEAFRPVVHPSIVKAAYGVSWAYVIVDVSSTGYLERRKPGATNRDVGEVVVKRAVFQSLASMALPAFTIHQTVHLASSLLKRTTRNVMLRRWGPTIAGLAVVPALPFIFDHPVEWAVEKAFTYIGFGEREHQHSPESTDAEAKKEV
ncbi:hypothetical protein M427DRAFT_51162 [Gonapodya prolifera JEL478]|uniref:Mitochondrial fission process protein 1 n=1 Tax=Gonapodya prolifera (strain JEL478) TaxID=1344416 RepID=A0A139AYF0_GONPJ|nr:hypothetical protein M427DRAFT_51162 [Gonapodya prolifera JEL478]|eukprot:KXS21782.1 hypothetical protein M427DRAFT_51162 [Gonapodya prolifera JEL478]